MFNWDNIKIFVEESEKINVRAFTGGPEHIDLVAAMAYVSARPNASLEDFLEDKKSGKLMNTIFIVRKEDGSIIAMSQEEAKKNVTVDITRLDNEPG